MKKAIVTGATGFIGRFLVRELLEQGVQVIAVVHRESKNRSVLEKYPVQIVECGMAEYARLPALLPERDISVLYHLAWQGVSGADARKADVQLSNLKAAVEIMEAAHEMGIGAFVGLGSLHEEESLQEMREGKPIANLGYYYKMAKLAAHGMTKAQAGTYGIRYFWPLINTYGEEENSARLVNTIIRKIFNGESPALSSGEQYYDFVHVSDVAHALYLIAEKGVDGANYMIGSGDAKPLKEFLAVVGQVANRMNGNTDIPLGFGQITSNVVSLPKEVFDVTNLSRDTGFVCRVPFEEGIERTARWIQQTV